MCLLVVCASVVPGFPLVVAANRDERLDRPATSITLLRDHSPAILGGRDELAGGTWLAVNDRGVLAGLTNRPAPGGRDPNRRSRGELPLLLAAQSTADDAVAAFADIDPVRYNPAWILVGDRESLFYLELDGFNVPICRPLSAGVHILENRPLDASSGKVDRARELLGDASDLSGDQLFERLVGVLSDHVIPPDTTSDPGGLSRVRPTCVHGELYGTRSSTIVLVPDGTGPATVLVADGRPCTTPFTDETARWPSQSRG